MAHVYSNAYHPFLAELLQFLWFSHIQKNLLSPLLDTHNSNHQSHTHFTHQEPPNLCSWYHIRCEGIKGKVCDILNVILKHKHFGKREKHVFRIWWLERRQRKWTLMLGFSNHHPHWLEKQKNTLTGTLKHNVERKHRHSQGTEFRIFLINHILNVLQYLYKLKWTENCFCFV